MNRLDMDRLPRHIAVIMDGNGRWAQKRNQPRVYGHREGVKAVRETVTANRELGIPHLTLFALSSENMGRPKPELDALMSLFHQYLDEELQEMLDNGIGFHPIGRWRELRDDVVDHMMETVEKTSHCKDMTLHLALNYGGRAEIVDACSEIADRARKGEIEGEITEEIFAGHIYTAGVPDPDLVIRTSGEKRISNFLLWQIAYCEIYFTPVLWPDFRKQDLYDAIADYQSRERRFGMTAEQIGGAGGR